MTNALEGRTYINYEWKLKDGLADWQKVLARFPRDYKQVSTEHVVPNGKWVLERPCNSWAWLIGVSSHAELEDIHFTDKHDTRHVLCVSDVPFGYIVAAEEHVDRATRSVKPTGRKRLVHARQIHKGELGQTVSIQRLPYVRQALELGESPSIKKRRKHGQRGWIRLIDLAEATDYSVGDIVFGFWQFSGHRSWSCENGMEVGQLLDIVVASSPDEIKYRCPKVLALSQNEAVQLVQTSVEDLWVRRGFAYTVLRLLALDIRPEVTQLV